jgi:subtilisin family serine protease
LGKCLHDGKSFHGKNKKMRLKQVLVLIIFNALAGNLPAQQIVNWQNLDLRNDSVFGISTDKAYREILNQKKKFKPVIVGVIDSGVDTAHEDLKAVIWTNSKEIYDGADNDHDGYIGDVHGWNFIGGSHGNIDKENIEMTRLIRSGKADSGTIAFFTYRHQEALNRLAELKGQEQVLDSMVYKMKKDTPTLNDFKAYKAQNDAETQIQAYMVNVLQQNPNYFAYRNEELNKYSQYLNTALNYYLNLNFNPRPSIVGDDSTNAFEHFYGNSDVMGPGAFHGSQIAGIIGAKRDNGLGLQGIADHIWIMSIRIVPDGDERDKDVANAIRFATDHGCKVINMSFGKYYSPEKKAVDEAVKYAMSKDVLIVQAAGNDGTNNDNLTIYPNRVYLDGTSADAYIVVGASAQLNDSNLVGGFSNWGKRSVDVFAPGVEIYSCVPGSKYIFESGTSLAAPMVTGLAALIREYYPNLSAPQVKQIILQSVIKPQQKIHVKDNGNYLSIPFSNICVSGGVVNVYNALKLAANF